jgi:glucan 1,3-beta-glucosidase
MVAFSAGALLLTLRVLLSATPSAAVPVAQAPAPAPQTPQAGASGYWFETIKRQGQAPFNPNPTAYKVFRNVKELGAKGDGSSDDTDIINKIIADGERCGEGCDSTTTTPAIIYFPAGTYMISKPIIQYYYTQFVGDATNMPILKATANFEGMGLIDADPYIPGGDGANWFTNQNNFYRQIRNFVIDISQTKAAAGIHWQVSQATSLQNIRFEMAKGDAGKDQKGIFQDNGSGGFMSDLIFNGGAIGAFLGSQQFTTRNMTFNDCGTAIFMNWNWLWTLKSIFINNCKLGLDMANSPANQTVGSVLLLDSIITNTPIGVNTSFTQDSVPHTGGTLILDNVDFTSCTTAIQNAAGVSKAMSPVLLSSPKAFSARTAGSSAASLSTRTLTFPSSSASSPRAQLVTARRMTLRLYKMLSTVSRTARSSTLTTAVTSSPRPSTSLLRRTSRLSARSTPCSSLLASSSLTWTTRNPVSESARRAVTRVPSRCPTLSSPLRVLLPVVS